MIRIQVTGMTCSHCENAVKRALCAVPGVRRVIEVSRVKELAEVDGEADPARLVAAIREEGYRAEVAP